MMRSGRALVDVTERLGGWASGAAVVTQHQQARAETYVVQLRVERSSAHAVRSVEGPRPDNSGTHCCMRSFPGVAGIGAGFYYVRASAALTSGFSEWRCRAFPDLEGTSAGEFQVSCANGGKQEISEESILSSSRSLVRVLICNRQPDGCLP